MNRVLFVRYSKSPEMEISHHFNYSEDNSINFTYVYSISEALQHLNKQCFCVMICDLLFVEDRGIGWIHEINGKYADLKMLMCTEKMIIPMLNDLLAAGVSGFIQRSSTRNHWMQAVNMVLEGVSVIPSIVLKHLQLKDFEVQVYDDQKIPRYVLFDAKEQDIMYLVSSGKSNKEIATMLYVSQRTLEYNLTTIYKKLGASSRVEAVMRSNDLGLICTTSKNEEWGG